jgi:hypothetical protein
VYLERLVNHTDSTLEALSVTNTMRPRMQRTTADGATEQYCTWCQTYHLLSSFATSSLRSRIYKCRASTVAANRRYRSRLSPRQRKCRRMLGKIRKRLGNPWAKQIQARDVETVVAAMYDQEGGESSSNGASDSGVGSGLGAENAQTTRGGSHGETQGEAAGAASGLSEPVVSDGWRRASVDMVCAAICDMFHITPQSGQS